MNRRSIAFRLMLLYSAILLLAGMAFSAFTIASFRLYTHRTLESVISTRANDVWNVTLGSLDDKAEVTALIERRFSPEIESRFIRVSLDGKLLYRSGMPADHTFDPSAVPPPRADRLPQTLQLGNLILYRKRFIAPGGGTLVIESGQSDAFFHGLDTSLVTSLAMGLPILLVVAAFGGYVLIRRALSPVELMIGAAEDISFNNPRTRLPLLGTADRIEALGEALNRMLDRLDNAYQHAGRFSADAAHEMRTPLAIIRNGLELAITKHDLPPRSREYLTDLLEEVTRLSHMTDSLLALTSMDNLWEKQARSTVDLFDLASEVADQMQLLAEERGIRLTMPAGERILVAGDRDRLKQALVNLLDNAINYTLAGGSIAIAVGREAGMAVMEVRDSGIGISAQAQEYIFDRFYRVATDRGQAGTGLGLAIVRAIAIAHGGSVEVRSRLGEGSTFTVRLPLAAAS